MCIRDRVVDQLTESFPELDYIVVTDGSKERTAEICRKRGYRLLDLPVNLGPVSYTHLVCEYVKDFDHVL